MTEWGENIERLRKQRGLRQKQLAEKAGLSETQISALIQGRGNPTIQTLRAVALALDVPLRELFATEHAPAPLSAEVDALVRAYEQTTIEGRQALTMLARVLLAAPATPNC